MICDDDWLYSQANLALMLLNLKKMKNEDKLGLSWAKLSSSWD